MAKNRNSRAKSKTPVAVAQVVAPQPEVKVAEVAREARATSLTPSVIQAPKALVEPAAPAPIVRREVVQMAKAEREPKQPSHDEIARRAYELWLRRGAPIGSHLEDWLSAERELTAA